MPAEEKWKKVKPRKIRTASKANKSKSDLRARRKINTGRKSKKRKASDVYPILKNSDSEDDFVIHDKKVRFKFRKGNRRSSRRKINKKK